jgi:hypothetical protein
MKIQGNTAEIERTGVAESRGFAIKASAQAFRILSDGLYSDKILAVIRELGSNAWDAHVSAGTTDRPFTVHLPNNIEPWYSIRDYGTGLAHDQVMNLYSTYFDSTKDSSNEFTGAMGLGSKSPFSYVDAFTVVSVVDGEKRIYMIDIGEVGVPTISLVEGSPFATDEDNGLEVKLAVKKSDFYDFCTKAQDVFKRYPLAPEVVGNVEFNIEKPEVLFEGSNWRILKNDGHYGQTCYALQGTVAYPINFNSLQGIKYEQRNAFNRMNCEIDFEIGDLEVSASREDLGYDERTSQNIIDALNRVVDELADQMDTLLEDKTSFWDAQAEVNRLADDQSIFWLFTSTNRKTLTWNNIKITPQPTTFIANEQVSFRVLGYRSWSSSSASLIRYSYDNWQKSDYSVLNYKVTLVVNDINTKGVARFKQYGKSKGVSRDNIFILVSAEDDASLAEWIKDIGHENKDYVLTSNLPDAPKKTRAPAKKLAADVANLVVHTPGKRLKIDLWQSETEVDLSTVEYKIDLYVRSLDFRTYGKQLSHLDAERLVGFAKNNGIIPTDAKLYGINRTNRAKVKKNATQAKDVVELVKEYVKKELPSVNLAEQDRANRNAFRNRISYQERMSAGLFSNIARSTSSTELTDFVNEYDKSVETVEDYDFFQKLANMFEMSITPVTGTPVELSKLFQQAYNKYPMLRHIELYSITSDQLNDYVNYVKLVDSQ